MRLHLLYANITEARTTTLQILKLLYAGVCHGEIDVPRLPLLRGVAGSGDFEEEL